MKKTLITAAILSLSLFAGHAFAASDCEAKAAEKKAKEAARLAESCQATAAAGQAEVLMALEANKQATNQALEVRSRRCCWS